MMLPKQKQCTAEELHDDYITIYSQLINIGFVDDIALEAAKQYDHDINAAINWIIKSQTIDVERANNMNDMYDCIDMNICGGQNILKCMSFNRIVSLMQFYAGNHSNYRLLNTYLSKNNVKSHLINDYHHILTKHLNDDTNSKVQVNEQFQTMYHHITNKPNNLCCHINKCNIYSRNNRFREFSNTLQLECNDKQLLIYIDILDSIHCHLIHSVDIGYRIIDADNINNGTNNECDSNNIAFDIDMHRLKSYLSSKRKNVWNARGENRMQNSKFMTQLTQESKQPKNVIDNEIIIKGYIYKQSFHLKRLRKRFVILQNECLHCYKDDQCNRLTEKIDLRMFSDVRILKNSEYLSTQFELVPIDKDNSSRLFEIVYFSDIDNWVSSIKRCIYPQIETYEKKVSNKDERKENKQDIEYSFGEFYDYWKNNDKWNKNMSQVEKYKSIKEEITSNKIFFISLLQFNNALNKAKYLKRNSQEIKKIKSNIDIWNVKYGIHNNSSLRVENILCVILYTDYDTLSSKFSATFRKLIPTESKQLTKRRNREFGNWTKTLLETVNVFGTTMKCSNVETFYHGLSMIYFNKFVAEFNSPTSTTTKLQIATVFANNNGIILELNSHSSLRFLNCSIFSAFANEEERLFIQPPWINDHYLVLLSIRNMSTDENYKDFIDAMTILERIITKNAYNSRRVREILERRMNTSVADDCIVWSEKYNNIINSLISARLGLKKNEDIKVPVYVQKTFKRWSNKHKIISVHLDELRQ
eukprot:132341_1